MLNRRFVVCASVGFVVIAAMFVRSRANPPATAEAESPATQNFRRVDRFAHVAAFLNLAQGTVRIVAIVPAELTSSLGVVDTITAVVRANPSKRLRAYVILKGGEDTPLQASVLAGRYPDPRIVYFWDPTGIVAGTWESGTTTVGAAWLYDTSAKFSDQPPASSLTVSAKTHGTGVVLDGAALRAQSDEMVRRVEAKMASAPRESP